MSGTLPESRRTRFHQLSDGRRLAFEDLGDPDGLPVFVFHGSPSCRLAPGLYPGEPIPWNVRLIAPDRPGFGQSDPQPGRTLADWPDDVAALADALRLDRFYLAGGSSGGPAVLSCGWKLSDRVVAAALVGGLAPPHDASLTAAMGRTSRTLLALARRAPFLVRLNYEFLAWLSRRNPVRAASLVVSRMAKADAAVLERPEIASMLREVLPETFRQGGRWPAAELSMYARAWPFALDEVTIPVDLWYGDADPTVPVEMGQHLAARLPNATLHVISGGGHLWVYDHLSEVLQALVGSNRAMKNG